VADPPKTSPSEPRSRQRVSLGGRRGRDVQKPVQDLGGRPGRRQGISANTNLLQEFGSELRGGTIPANCLQAARLKYKTRMPGPEIIRWGLPRTPGA